MKLLFTNFHQHGGGGHDTYIYELAQALSSDHAVSVAAPVTSHLFEKISGLKTVGLFPIHFKVRLSAFGKFFHSIMTLRRLLVTERYDIIHVNGSSDHTLVILASFFILHRAKIVFTKHNTLPLKWGAKLRYRYRTDRIIAVSESAQKTFTKEIKTPITVIANGVNVDLFSPVNEEKARQLRENYGLTPETFVIGSVAGTAAYKGWEFLLKAMAEIRDQLTEEVKIVMAGDLPAKEVYEANITKLGLADIVLFVGWIDDVTQVIPLFDIGFVLSYDIETISFACRQMMAMGKPVLVSNYGGLPENVTDNVDGWITQAKNVAAIKRSLLAILKNKQQLPVMSLKAREKAVREFTDKQWIADTLAVYTACT
jgi:glycosyltransferase involved in cell wall biosynthesis